MFDRLRSKLNMLWFNQNTKTILGTPPVECDPQAAAVLVTQLCHRDILMYLLAVKSLARFVPLQKLFILDDTSLTTEDKNILQEHISQVEIISIMDVSNENCPKGCTWERLLFISDLVESSYIIQSDGDTLTLKRPDEVISFIKDGTSFILAGDMRGTEIISMAEACIVGKKLRHSDKDFVQIVCEASLDKLPNYQNLKYVRGCSGFTGFAKQSFSRGRLEAFSASLAEIVGQNKWYEWGSEQVACNCIVANIAGGAVLPFPKYCSQFPSIDINSSTFIHFIGSHRFMKGNYTDLAKKTIIELLQFQSSNHLT